MLTVFFRYLSRSRFFYLLAAFLFFIGLSVCLTYLFGGRQPVVSALDVGFSFLRLALPLLIVFGVQDLLYKEFDRKFYALSLSYPVSRASWLISRFVALLMVCLLSLALAAVLLALLIWGLGSLPGAGFVGFQWSYWVVIGFVGVDTFLLLCVAFLFAMVASTPSFILLGTLGFMLIARSYSVILGLLASGSGLVLRETSYRGVLEGLYYIVPDLSVLDIRMVALYGRMGFMPGDWISSIVGVLIYALGLLALAVWLFQRKRLA